MSGITVWHDPMSLRYYLEEGHVIEEVHPVTRRFIEGLNADKDKLQEQVEQLFDEAFNLSVKNAKLRRLMSTMRKTLDSAESDVCSHCDFFGNCADNDWHECEFDKRMRELGIEVCQ